MKLDAISVQLALKSSKNEYAVGMSLNRWRWGRALCLMVEFRPSIVAHTVAYITSRIAIWR